MNVLVTGGAGFIGSNFIRHMLAKYPSYKIINYDNLTYAGNLDNLKDVEKNPNYEFVNGNICDEKLVESVMTKNKVDWIVNFAAESHVDRSIEGPYVFTKSNILGTHVLLECARKFGIKRFLQIGTDEVYGSIPEGSSNEKDALEPNSPYSASKTSADLLVRSYLVTFSLPVIITRSSNNFGPYQYPEKLIPLFVTNLLDGKKVPVYGDGLNIRDWIYVIDNCEAIDFVLHNGKTGEIYNIGGGNEKTNLEITRRVLLELGKNDSFIEFVKDRPGHDQRYSLDCSKIAALGWKPRFSFEEALKKTVQWYKCNEQWWKKLKK
jgi:dTDP-glucose 4,6-dehydratase